MLSLTLLLVLAALLKLTVRPIGGKYLCIAHASRSFAASFTSCKYMYMTWLISHGHGLYMTWLISHGAICTRHIVNEVPPIQFAKAILALNNKLSGAPSLYRGRLQIQMANAYL